MAQLPGFRELVDLEQWQRIQDHFADVLRVRIRTVDVAGEAITIPSGPTAFCEQTIGSSSVGRQRCGRCLPASILEGSTLIQEFESDHCHVLTKNFAVPITVMETLPIAYLLVGPVLLGRREGSERYVTMAQEMGIPLDRLMGALQELRLFTYAGVRSVLALLRGVAAHVVQLGYQVARLREIVPWLSGMEGRITPLYLDRLLQALLDAATTASKADASSIMVFHPDRDELSVRLAKGLKEEVVRGARVAVSESLSGLVVERGAPLVVSAPVTDQQVSRRLRRPELRSSMLVPIIPMGQTRPMGVLSLGVTRTESLYRDEDVGFVRQLVNLAEVALAGLGAASASTHSGTEISA